MKEVLFDYGDSKMSVELPDSAYVMSLGELDNDPPEVDPVEAAKKALEDPLTLSRGWIQRIFLIKIPKKLFFNACL